jgi:hypothetical protein
MNPQRFPEQHVVAVRCARPVDERVRLRPCQPSQRTIMMAKKSSPKSLQLGRAVEWPDSPEKAQLDRVPNPQADTNYLVRFTAPDFDLPGDGPA